MQGSKSNPYCMIKAKISEMIEAANKSFAATGMPNILFESVFMGCAGGRGLIFVLPKIPYISLSFWLGIVDGEIYNTVIRFQHLSISFFGMISR